MRHRKHKQLDWDPLIEEGRDPRQQETAADEAASLLAPSIRGRAYAAASVFGLFMNDINAEGAYAQRCPKCGRRTLVRVRAGDPKSPWKCTRCGNDSDEFGNKL